MNNPVGILFTAVAWTFITVILIKETGKYLSFPARV